MKILREVNEFIICFQSECIEKYQFKLRTATSVVVPLTANILLQVHWRAFDTACF